MRYEGNEGHSAAPGFDDIGPHHRGPGVVRALRQNVGSQSLDQRERRRVIEQHDSVDSGKSRQNPGPLRLGHEWPAGSLGQGPDRGVGVEPHDQDIAHGPGIFQVGDVPGMEEVEDTVGKDNRPARRASPGQGVTQTYELRRRTEKSSPGHRR